MTRRREILTVAALGLAVLTWSAPAASGQETSAASDPVAQVGDAPIPLADYEHWFASAVHSTFGRPIELVGPGYARCVVTKRRQRARKGRPRLGAGELRVRCARDARTLHRQVLQFLIQGQWVTQEAAARGLAVSDRRVDRTFRRQRRVAFPNDGAYRRFLRESGTDEADIKHRIRLDLLQLRLTQQVTGRVRAVTRRDVRRYRSNHRRQFAGMPARKANARARAYVRALREQRALSAFIPDFRERWRAGTWCAAGYRVAECGALARPPSP